MATTYELIKGETLTGTAASYTFSAIPAAYTDLLLKCSTRSNAASRDDYFRLTVNGDSSTLYSSTRLLGTGSAASSARGSSQAFVNAIYTNSNVNTANTFGSTDIYIPSYAATTSKPMGIFTAEENNTTASNIETLAGLYTGTSGITSISLVNIGSTVFLAGSSFYLYGIKNS